MWNLFKVRHLQSQSKKQPKQYVEFVQSEQQQHYTP